MIKRKRTSISNGFLLAITAAVLWGVSGTFGQFLFQKRDINPEWLVTVRLLFSGAILLLIASTNNPKELWRIWKVKKDAWQLLSFSLFGMLAVQYTYFAAIKHSNAATATVLQYVGPVLIAVYIAIQKEKWPRNTEILAIFLAITGTFLLVTHGSFRSLSISNWALFWGIASAVALAFYSLQPMGLLSRYPATIVIGWSMLIGGVFLSSIHAPWIVRGQWDIYTYLSTAFIILLATLVAFYAYLTAVKIIGAQKASLLASAEPLSATILSVVWLQVPFTAMDWIGSCLIVATIFLLASTKEVKAKNLEPQNSI
ncbi:permease [Adhaeribacter aerolatus]|uniref:Permease n=1 Tax=Adhaeribacter aerolatus TaxID=670289 RepID=A0A512AW84_9BACT|nr:EamA family transporter [Adhaeribacter aerolatus]GEO03988.1 permease [Adhaeribacter aerolatus]